MGPGGRRTTGPPGARSAGSGRAGTTGRRRCSACRPSAAGRGRARGGESLGKLLPEAFGLVCVAAHRVLQIRLFDVQLAGGIVMHEGGLAEMATGEGKTVPAALPAYLNALPGKGVHLTTVNDYLARRDAESIGPIHQALGLTVGYLQQETADEDRAAAHRCDITYG